MKKKYLAAILSLATLGFASVITLTLTSWSSSPKSTLKVKELDMGLYKGPVGEEQHQINIKDVNKVVDYDPTDLIYGDSSANGGKYMFIYGTVGFSGGSLAIQDPSSLNINVQLTNPIISPFYKWLTENNPSDDIKDNFNNFNISNTFFDAWFNDNPDNKSPYKNVKIYTYIDIPPVAESVSNPAHSEQLDQVIPVDPFCVYTNDDVLNIYKWRCQKDGLYPAITFDELPINWKMLSGTYMRQDPSAVEYRRLVDYVQQVRPTLSSATGSDTKNSGVICFDTTSKSPFTGVLDKASIGDFGSAGATLLADVGSSWKMLYHMFNGKTWDDEKQQEQQDTQPQ